MQEAGCKVKIGVYTNALERIGGKYTLLCRWNLEDLIGVRCVHYFKGMKTNPDDHVVFVHAVGLEQVN